MQYVPVQSSTGKPLMPCHAARARELVRKGRAVGRFNKGIYYIRLLDRADGEVQPIAVGVDPGSKREGFTVKSETHTYLNVQAEAVDWVGKHMEVRKMLRRGRRSRKTPYRKQRQNRARGGIPPSTKARWHLKLRVLQWLAVLYPLSIVVVEDIAAVPKEGKHRWNKSFSPLEVGKAWFYREVEKMAELWTFKGYQTAEMRQAMDLKKSSQKLSTTWEAHCVDSFVLATIVIGGPVEPDNKEMLILVPLQLHRRALHRANPQKGGVRPPYGGTKSMGFKRGSWVKHPKWGVCYVGGASVGKGGISLHSLTTGKRLTQSARPEACHFLCHASWRVFHARQVGCQ
ncbi:MAG: RRXRR domain-containing protein [Ardenticatenales bacterium]|nr:RRXRR domain-containing protein [Ardenticatenales bacterium]